MIVPGSELDSIEREELSREDRHQRRLMRTLAQHPDPRDPDHPAPDDDAVAGVRTCLSCFSRHPFNADGTPFGGALPCGH